MTATCPYRADCLERWRVTRIDYRCGFEIANTVKECPRARQYRQIATTRPTGVDTGNVESGHRGGVAGSAPPAQLPLPLGGEG